MANGVSEMLWLERILEELRIPVNMPIKLYCDNKAVISIAHNPVQHDHCKRHVEIDKHFKKEISKKKTGKKKNQAAYTLHTCMKNFYFQVTYLTLQFSSRKTHAKNCMS
jgi:hypothetical protein